MSNYKSFIKTLITLFVLCAININAVPKTWTFLMYITAENELCIKADELFEQLRQIDSNEQVNVLIYSNLLRSDKEREIKRLIIDKNNVEKRNIELIKYNEENIFLDALKVASKDFESDHLFITIWDHDPAKKSNSSYIQALDTVVKEYRNGNKVDFISFDIDCMAHMETYFALQPYAHYAICSQEKIASKNFDYREIISLMNKKNNSISPLFLKLLIQEYHKFYLQGPDQFTFALVDLEQLHTVVNSLNSITNDLISLMNSDYAKYIKHALNSTNKKPRVRRFAESTHIDLCNYYYSLYLIFYGIKKDVPQLNDICIKLKDAIREMNVNGIVNRACSTDLLNAHGISIYSPEILTRNSQESSRWALENPQWYTLLNMIHN